MYLSGLSPFGPIFGKELRTAARRRRNYFLRVAYLGGLLLFLLLAWTVTRNEFGRGGGIAARAQQQEQLGLIFFAFFSMFCVGAMGLIGPVLTSTAINGERQAKTLHVLLMTPLTAWQIVSGKLFSRLLTALTLMGLSMPVLALVRLLGGVDLEQMFGVLCLCAVTAMFGAAVGLLLSILVKRAYAVIILSYMLFLVMYLFTPMLVAALWSTRAGRLPWMRLLGSYNPFFGAGVLGWGQARMLKIDWVTCTIAHVVATIVLLIISSWLVRRMARNEGEGAVPVGNAVAPEVPSPRGVPSRADIPLESRSSRLARTVSDLPVLWREMRRPLMTRTWQRVTTVVGVIALMTLAYVAAGVNDGLKDNDFHIFLAFCFYTILMLLACVLSATSITQEKEGESWTVLLASPISGAEIIWAKAAGVGRRMFWPLVLVIAHFGLFTLFGIISPLEFLLIMVVMVGFNSIWIATGVAISLWFRKVTAAVITNLALPVLLYGAGSVVLVVIDSLFGHDDRLIRQVCWYLPYYYFAEGITQSYRWSSGRQMELPGLRMHVSMGIFVLVAMIIATLHLLAAAGILAWAAKSFNSIVGRASQWDRMPAKSSITSANKPAT